MDAYTTTPAQGRTGEHCPRHENARRGCGPGRARGTSASNRRADYNQDRRRLPPYAHRLRAVLANPACWGQQPYSSADGSSLSLFVLAGPDAWDTAAHWTLPRMVQVPMFVLAPPGEDPGQFDWSLLRGHPPILVRFCGDLTRGDEAALVAAIIRDGGERVLVLADSTRLYRGGRHA